MSGGELKKAKREIRRRVRTRRDAMPAGERALLGRRAIDRFLELPEVGRAEVVMVFWSFGSEVPTAPLIGALHGRGVVVALPRVQADRLVPVVFEPGQATLPTAFGSEEPVAGAQVEPASIDVVAVPGVAFDRGGGRIGYGGGFYDRFLGDTGALTVGLAFGLQIVEGRVPGGRFDVGVDVIVTEDETIRPPRERRT